MPNQLFIPRHLSSSEMNTAGKEDALIAGSEINLSVWEES